MNLKKTKIELMPTISDHWYRVGKKYYPSSTTILNAYPLAYELVKWLADQGWDTSQRIKLQAGESGTKIHDAIEILITTNNILARRNYSLEEWYKLSTFVAWYEETKPEVVATEIPLYSRKYGYAGRADALCKISGKYVLVDWKTSKSIYPHFKLQTASYAQALQEMNNTLMIAETAILQLGAKNKKGYRFVTEDKWQEHFKIFLNVKKTWEFERGITKNFVPPILNLPDTLQL